MASFTLTRPDRFPDGTTVNAYAVSNWPAGVNQASAPVGSSAASGTVSSNSVTFDGLTAGARYVAYALVSSQHRYIEFVAGEDVGDQASLVHSSNVSQISVLTQSAYNALTPDSGTLYVIVG